MYYLSAVIKLDEVISVYSLTIYFESICKTFPLFLQMKYWSYWDEYCIYFYSARREGDASGAIGADRCIEIRRLCHRTAQKANIIQRRISCKLRTYFIIFKLLHISNNWKGIFKFRVIVCILKFEMFIARWYNIGARLGDINSKILQLFTSKRDCSVDFFLLWEKL